MCAAGGHQQIDSSPPSRFIERWVGELSAQLPAPRRALDVAMGRGRHARLLAAHGFATFGVDMSFDVVRDAKRQMQDDGRVIHAWCADLTAAPLPSGRFELIVVTRYLQRDLFPALADALVPGGVLLYETFTEAQRALGWGPTSEAHLLRAGELLERTRMLEAIVYEEVEAPEAVARLAARKAISRA